MISDNERPLEEDCASQKDSQIANPANLKNEKKLKRLRKLKTKLIIYHPQKTIRMIVYYRIPGDMHIAEHNSSLHSYNMMKDVNEVKKIVSIFNEKDANLIGCNLVNTLEYSPPLGLLIHRLQSLGDTNAYELSKTVESVSNIISSLKTNMKPRKNIDILSRPSFQAFMKKNLETTKELSEKYPLMVYQHNNFEEFFDHRLTQLSYSYKLINMLGHDIDGFILKLKNHRLPECVWMDGEFFNIMDQILKSIFFPGCKLNTPTFRIKKNGSFFRPQQKYIINRFEEDDYMYSFYIHIICLEENELDSLKIGNRKKKENGVSLSVSEVKQNISLMIEENCFKKDTLKWVTNSYPNLNIIVRETEDQAIRCGYKELNLNN